ncbi:MAG: hypothetical protein C0483_04435 [Pirellula sp.]|nr:hypothetical protein [Pirellula sp.]
MLGVGEENYTLVVVSIIVSVASLVLCDRLRWIQINNLVSNIASVAVLIFAVVLAGSKESDQRVLIMAELMAHLQFILQFKAKTVRNYWLLAMVSFLQTSVAAALQTGLAFAVLLVVYLFWALFFLGIFYLYREQLRHSGDAAAKLKPSRRNDFVSRPASEGMLDGASREFSRRMIGLAFGTLAMATLLFVAVPRIGKTGWEPVSIVETRTVGFSTEIKLGSGGQVIEDPEVVMQVRFFDYRTDAPLQIDGDVYMRGTAVMEYADGNWKRGNLRPFFRNGLPPITELASDQGLIRQKIAIEPLSRNVVFSCYPAFTDRVEESRQMFFHQPLLGQITRVEPLRTKRFEYEIVTPAFQRMRQGAIVPSFRTIYDEEEFLDMPAARDGRDPLAGLKQTALQLVADIPAGNIFQRAKRLESYFRDSGRFQYSLDPLERPQGVDPVEDFVVDRPQGHCEYFAGGLALMLRAVGIPSRVVLGYRGGQYNVVGGFYEFQQLHAHSWVEAYLPPSEVPLDRLMETPGLIPPAEKYGAWLQLDGTAPTSFSTTAVANTTWSHIQQGLDYVRFLWVNYVIGMDSARQFESVYGPVTATMTEVTKRITDRSFWNDWRRRAAGGLRALATPWGALLLMLGAGLTFALVRVMTRFRRRSTDVRKGPTKRPRRMAPPTEEFYLRLERLLTRHSIVRTADQTPREWALAAGGELSELAHTRSAAPLPRRIVDYYYRVRFGNRPLDAVEHSEVEQALVTLEQAMTPPDKPQRR